MRRALLIATLVAATSLAQAETVKEGLDALQRGDVERARVVLETLAGQNDREAQYQLALLYEGAYNRPELAATWFQAAGNAGHLQSLNDLGVMYYEGRGVPQDRTRAFGLYRKAADGGLAAAQYNVALMLGRGDAVPVNLTEATRWLEKAAAQGYDKAQAQLGRLYLEGSAQEARRGVELLQKAAEQGNPWAYLYLGMANLRGVGTPRNLDAARELIEKAAAKNLPSAMYRLAVLNEYGMGGEPADEARARDLYIAAAEQGDADAIRRLVRAYTEGGLTLRPDPQRAKAWGDKLPPDKR